VEKRSVVHLAYLDDSAAKFSHVRWQVMSGVIIEDKAFKLTEVGVAIVPELLMPADKLAQFDEFHACQLYHGTGIFEGIDQVTRFEAITRLLTTLEFAEIAVVYGGVNLARLKQQIYGSADPLDMSFRSCIQGIQEWATQDMNRRVRVKLGEDIENYTLERSTPHVVEGIMEELVILIVDECDKKVRETLQNTYRSLRPPRNVTKHEPFSNLHDDMYFGDSRYSVGIQLADLCSYFIAQHLAGDTETEHFYEMIKPHITYAQVHPPPDNPQEVNRLLEMAAPKEITDGE
jgi:Protein of unknown function (DUF3800)